MEWYLWNLSYFTSPLGLALLTLSWDKNWDSHSLVNGYPSFYPRIALVAPSPGLLSACKLIKLEFITDVNVIKVLQMRLYMIIHKKIHGGHFMVVWVYVRLYHFKWIYIYNMCENIHIGIYYIRYTRIADTLPCMIYGRYIILYVGSLQVMSNKFAFNIQMCSFYGSYGIKSSLVQTMARCGQPLHWPIVNYI